MLRNSTEITDKKERSFEKMQICDKYEARRQTQQGAQSLRLSESFETCGGTVCLYSDALRRAKHFNIDSEQKHRVK